MSFSLAIYIMQASQPEKHITIIHQGQKKESKEEEEKDGEEEDKTPSKFSLSFFFTCTILTSSIIPLSIFLGGIDFRPKDIQELLIGDLSRIIEDLCIDGWMDDA